MVLIRIQKTVFNTKKRYSIPKNGIQYRNFYPVVKEWEGEKLEGLTQRESCASRGAKGTNLRSGSIFTCTFELIHDPSFLENCIYFFYYMYMYKLYIVTLYSTN